MNEMNEKFSRELDEEFLEQFYMEAGEMPPSKETANVEDFKRALKKIKTIYSASKRDMSQFTNNDVDDANKKKILIVDDLGVVNYQLGLMLNREGFLPISSQEIYDAITKYKKQHFDMVLLDLFIPTEREGFLLLDEIVKINNNKEKKSAIGIMTASNKKEHKQICKDRGAAFFIEKSDDWQRTLVELCRQVLNG